MGAGAPAHLAVLSMSYLSSLGSSLTHYGTTTSPIYYGAGYLSQGAWWRVGLLVATVNASGAVQQFEEGQRRGIHELCGRT